MKAKKRYNFERIEMLRKGKHLKLARFHGTSIDYLLNLTDESKPYPPRKE